MVTIGVVAFCLLGPYSYLGGAFALDFGGKQASAASSGIIDGIGYLGGVLAGDSVARLAVAFGWEGVFVALAVISAVAAAVRRRSACAEHPAAARSVHALKPQSIRRIMRAHRSCLTIEWADGSVSEFASVWLRDNRRRGSRRAQRPAAHRHRRSAASDRASAAPCAKTDGVRIDWEGGGAACVLRASTGSPPTPPAARRAGRSCTVQPWLEGGSARCAT